MKGRLIKTEANNFALVMKDSDINVRIFKYIVDSVYGSVVADVFGRDLFRLSKSNCKSIELGYDLEELLDINVKKYAYDSYSDYVTAKSEWKNGFEEAVSLLDKKSKTLQPKLIDSMCMRYRHDFGIIQNEEEKKSIRTIMTQLWEEVVGLGFYDGPKEWDVEIEMDFEQPCPKCGEKENLHINRDYSESEVIFVNTLCNECGHFFNPTVKLDNDKCLILKRL